MPHPSNSPEIPGDPSVNSQIQALPEAVVHAIAAGEVIDSLAAVVRELVDNSLDAGATRIQVAVWPDRGQVRVSDNGQGMTWGDLQAAAQPHSTSKIREGADLWRISSLGFRGEALYSLAQMGRLEICSRSALDPQAQGWRQVYDLAPDRSALDRPAPEPCAMAPGTIVQVSHLFEQWPARRQALPNTAQQLKAIQHTLQTLALCHPTLTWEATHSDRPWFSLRPGTTPQDILPQLLPSVQPSDLQFLSLAVTSPEAEDGHPPRLGDSRFEQDNAPVGRVGPLEGSHGGTTPTQTVDSAPVPATLDVVVGLPDRCHRRRSDWVKVAVNGRMVQMPELEQSMIQAFRRTLPRDRFPVCFVHLHLSPDHIDWNRHPAKREIYLRHLDFWQTQIQQAIDQALSFRSESLNQEGQTQRVGQLLKAAEQAQGYAAQRQVQGPVSLSDDLGAIEAGADRGWFDRRDDDPDRSSPSPLGATLRAMAQLHQMYILAEHPTGIWLIEQHIAHERVLFEQIQDRWELVPLQSPLIVEDLSDRQVAQLQRLGIEVEVFGEQVWAVRSAPALVADRSDCREAILELSRGGDLSAAQAATACRSAIRNGQVLTLPEMQQLLDQWQRTRNPRTCPHGRPICLTLEESRLSRFFRRHWVIGKSHGI
ncbi:MAG: DNA mismatch repair endonuclease MutL [Prochlorothrix sp.]